jgi:hypothetical protein
MQIRERKEICICIDDEMRKYSEDEMGSASETWHELRVIQYDRVGGWVLALCGGTGLAGLWLVLELFWGLELEPW